PRLGVGAKAAGEKAVKITREAPPYRETRRYVSKILRRINYRGVAVIYGSSTRRVVTTASTMKPQIRPAVYVPPARPEPHPDADTTPRASQPRPRQLAGPETPREILGPWAPTPMIRSVTAPRTRAVASGPLSESP